MGDIACTPAAVWAKIAVRTMAAEAESLPPRSGSSTGPRSSQVETYKLGRHEAFCAIGIDDKDVELGVADGKAFRKWVENVAEFGRVNAHSRLPFQSCKLLGHLFAGLFHSLLGCQLGRVLSHIRGCFLRFQRGQFGGMPRLLAGFLGSQLGGKLGFSGSRLGRFLGGLAGGTFSARAPGVRRRGYRRPAA